MNISQSAIALLYLYAFLLGGCLGLLYDGFRITRIFLGVHYSSHAVERLHSVKLPLIGTPKTHGKSPALVAVVFIEDFVFCIISGVALILLFYEAFNGKVRFPALVLSVLGFFAYRQTIGRAVMLFSEVIAFGVSCLLRYVMFFVLFPFRWLFGKLCRAVRRTVNIWLCARRKRERQRFTRRSFASAEQTAGGMFPGTGAERKERRYAKRKEKTVQPESADADLSGGDGGGVARRVH